MERLLGLLTSKPASGERLAGSGSCHGAPPTLMRGSRVGDMTGTSSRRSGTHVKDPEPDGSPGSRTATTSQPATHATGTATAREWGSGGARRATRVEKTRRWRADRE